MAKILISDLFGTLVPHSVIRANYNYLYGNDEDGFLQLLDDIFEPLVRDLTPFLEEGNSIKIVSMLDGRAPIDLILDVIVSRFYENLDDYKSQIEIYLCPEKTEPIDPKDLKKPFEQYEENGVSYYKYNNEFVFGVIQNKADIYDIIKEKYDIENDKIYCIGDSETDLLMLAECINLGGVSSLIMNNLWTYTEYREKSVDNIIWDKANMDYCLMIEQEILKSCPDYSNLNYFQRREIRNKVYNDHDRESWVSARGAELCRLFNDGNLDVHGIFEDRVVYDMVSLHYDRYLEKKTFSENRADELFLYATFSDFSNDILMKKDVKEYKKS